MVEFELDAPALGASGDRRILTAAGQRAQLRPGRRSRASDRTRDSLGGPVSGVVAGTIAEAEDLQRIENLARLRGQFLRARGHLFGRRRILLDDLIQLLDRRIDLTCTDVLLTAGGAD